MAIVPIKDDALFSKRKDPEERNRGQRLGDTFCNFVQAVADSQHAATTINAKRTRDRIW